MAAMFQKAVLSVEDPQRFDVVHQAIEAAFTSPAAVSFLKSLQKAKLRIRDFESVLTTKRLGEVAFSEYHRLSDVDQGQIREFYLASLEQVAPDLRQKFFKLYAYY